MQQNKNADDNSIIEVSSRLADWFHPENGEEIPKDLLGAEIVAFGAPISKQRFSGGGLIVDYKTKRGEIKRYCLAFDETGMWSIIFE